MTSTLTPRRAPRPRPAVAPSKHARRRRVKPGRPAHEPGRLGRLLGRVSRRTRWSTLAVTVAVGGLLGWLVLYSPVLAVRSVEVTGTNAATAAVVEDLAAVPDGVPLARLDLAAVEGRLAALPQLAAVSVERDWPGAVRIVVRERVGLAVIEQDGGRWLVDREGVLFAQVTDPRAGVPTLEVADPAPTDRTTLAALEVIAALPADIRERTTVVSAGSPDSVVLTLAGGRTVIWGSAADSERKALVLAGLFDRPARVIDVSSPSAVVLR